MDNLPAELLPSARHTLADCKISTRLWRLLSSSTPASVEVGEIVADPEFHHEAKRVAKLLGPLTSGCGPAAVRLALQPLVLVYGVGEAAQSAAFWNAYVTVLKDVPAEALAAAVEDYMARPDAEFFPKPGPLRDLAMKHAEPIYKAFARARRAASYEASKPGAAFARIDPPNVRKVPTEMERSAVSAMRADYKAKAAEFRESRAMSEPSRDLPPMHGRTEGGAITPEMRKLIADQSRA